MGLTWPPTTGGTWVLDLDGVVWLNGEAIAGSAEGVAALRASGVRTVFCTNNSSLTVGELRRRLAHVGIDADPGDLVTSAEAAAGMVAPGSRVVALAGEGVTEALCREEWRWWKRARRTPWWSGGPAASTSRD